MRLALTAAIVFVSASGLLTACSGSTTSDVGGPSPSGSGSGTKGGPVEPAPREVPQSTFTGSNMGCSNVSAYRASADGTQWVGIVVDKDQQGLKVGGSKKTIDLGDTPAGVEVFVDVYARAVAGGDEYCTDFRAAPPAKARWNAQAGSLTIELTPDPTATPNSLNPNPTYRATLRLEGVHVTGPEGGSAVIIPNVVIENVRVGWLPG